MNVLVMSIANKIPMLKAIRAAISKRKFAHKLYGADMKEDCLGRFFVDHFWLCPILSDISLDQLISFCKQHKIRFIFLSRDGELNYFANIQAELLQHHIYVMVSGPDVVELCLDKLLFYEHLSKDGYPVIETKSTLNQGYEGYVIKERYGSGSQSISIGLSYEDAIVKLPSYNEPIVQPYVGGIEYSVDVYISSRTGRAVGAVARKRVKVVNGESQITSSCQHEQLEKLCISIVENYCFRGHVMFQILIDKSSKIHIIECNARFGGASTLAIAMGLDSFYWFMNENAERPEEVIFRRNKTEKTLVRHVEDYIL